MKRTSSCRGKKCHLDVSGNSPGSIQHLGRCQANNRKKPDQQLSKYFSNLVPEKAIRSSLPPDLAEEYLSFVRHCENRKRKDDISDVSKVLKEKEQQLSEEKSSQKHKENLPAQKRKLDSSEEVVFKIKRQRKDRVRNLLKCVICSKEFPTKEMKQAHYDDHRGPKGYECIYCVKAFDKMPALVSHVSRIHLIDKKLSCKVCGKTFRREWLLRSHSLIHTSRRKFSCPICKMGFSHKTQLFQHISSHVGYNPHKCEECEKRFRKSSYLSIHRRMHVSVRPFKCKVCNVYCSSYTAVKTHAMLHESNSGFECKACNVRVPAHIMATHLASHNRIKNFQCDLCPAKFVAKSTLRDHLIAHSYIKEFECDVCKKVLGAISDCSDHNCLKWEDGFSVKFCHHCNAYVREIEFEKHFTNGHSEGCSSKSNSSDVDDEEDLCDENGDCVSFTDNVCTRTPNTNSNNDAYESDCTFDYLSESSHCDTDEDYFVAKKDPLDLSEGLVKQIRQMENGVEDDSDEDA